MDEPRFSSVRPEAPEIKITFMNREIGFFALRHFAFYMLLLCAVATACVSKTPATPQDSISNSVEINIADPTIFFHGGTYYLYGTVESDASQGFLVYTSTDLESWHGPKGAREGYALLKGDAFGTMGFWAPQVFYHRQKFYMAYTANEQIAIAESDSPLGPFTQTVKAPLSAPVKQIDPFIYIDEGGTKYLYHVRLTEGNRIFVAEMKDDFSAIKPETLRECIAATEPWENTAGAKWPVAEGPTVLKHNGLYYLTYSANDFRNPDYAVGYATSKSPLGPWLKSEGNPIISRNHIGATGTGHGDFLKDSKGDLLYVLHTHQSDSTVGPRKTAIVKAAFSNTPTAAADGLTIDKASFFYPKLCPTGN